MITDAILDFVFGAVEATFVLLPPGDVDLPEGPMWTVLAAANVVLPLDLFLTFSGIGVSIMTAGLGYWVVMKVVNVIRGSGA